MIKYSKIDKTFKTKKEAENFIRQTRGYANNKLDRAYVKKVGTSYVVMYYTFSKSIQDKITGIVNMSRRTSKPYSYYEVAQKTPDWIKSTHTKLDNL